MESKLRQITQLEGDNRRLSETLSSKLKELETCRKNISVLEGGQQEIHEL